MTRLSLIVLPFLLAVGCSKRTVKSESQNNLTYLALGDSYTIGESVSKNKRWPNQLQKTLSAEGLGIEMPRIIAKTGWTTNELNEGINNNLPNGNYDLVSLLIGVNNQFRGLSIEEFKMEFEALLERSIGFAGNDKSKVFVVSIPDYGVTPFGQTQNSEKIGKEIDAYNAAKKIICDAKGISFFDITPISRQAIYDKGLVASDGLHPSGKMYGQWVALIGDDILKKLVK
ncbi:MAG: lysophospholipase L1-like esterase [Algoriphagus sp.]|jgi:lysophospholipase L1-like esterase